VDLLRSLIWYVVDVTAALFELLRARVDVGGIPVIDGLSLETRGDRVVVLGGAKALFEAVSGVRTPVHGEVRVRGVAARSATRVGSVAGAPVSPPLSPRWTARDYVAWSARLSGHGKKEAKDLADEALFRMNLSQSASQKLLGTSPEDRRSVSIAAALATGAETIFLEEPVAGLPDETARHFARVVLRALEDRSWAVFAARLPFESPLSMEADEAVVVTGSRVLAQGAPAEIAARERTFAVRIVGRSENFAQLARNHGIQVVGVGSDLTLDLGESLLTTSDVLRIALQAEATVLELEPVAHALS
jgi:ABC-type multidrug transport system ATPase subunit